MSINAIKQTMPSNVASATAARSRASAWTYATPRGFATSWRRAIASSFAERSMPTTFAPRSAK
jgi:hypothetical protein